MSVRKKVMTGVPDVPSPQVDRDREIADARKKARIEVERFAKLESESQCEIGLHKFMDMHSGHLGSPLIIDKTYLPSLIEYLDSSRRELCIASTMLYALKIINKYALHHAIRFEDALIVLETQLYTFQDKYSIYRPEVKKVIEKKMEEAGILAGSIFDEKAAAEKAARDIIEAEAKCKAEEQRKIEAEAYKQSILTTLKHAKHNFKEIGKEYVRWIICPKISEISAIIQINGQSPEYTPTDFLIPETWNTHFEEGLIPFLPSCPFCKKQNIIHSVPNNILWVMCNDHYKWDPVANKHYKYDKFPPRKPEFNHLGVEYCPLNTGHPSEGRWVIWDPADPDGALAKKAAAEKEIAEIEKAIAELQAKRLMLKSV
jgi:hypothetical protein